MQKLIQSHIYADFYSRVIWIFLGCNFLFIFQWIFKKQKSWDRIIFVWSLKLKIDILHNKQAQLNGYKSIMYFIFSFIACNWYNKTKYLGYDLIFKQFSKLIPRWNSSSSCALHFFYFFCFAWFPYRMFAKISFVIRIWVSGILPLHIVLLVVYQVRRCLNFRFGNIYNYCISQLVSALKLKANFFWPKCFWIYRQVFLTFISSKSLKLSQLL